MTALGHVAVASVVRGNPVIRIIWGILSHGVLDSYMPEYRPDKLYASDPSTWLKNWKWLFLQIVGPFVFAWVTGDWWAILYGLLPDIIEGLYITYHQYWGNPLVWMRGDLLFPFHRAQEGIRQDKWTLKQTMKVEIVLSVLAIYTVTLLSKF